MNEKLLPSSACVELKPIKASIIEKLKISTDLTETAVQHAIYALARFGDVPKVIIVPQIEVAIDAPALAEKFGLGYVVIPTIMAALDSWAIAGYTHVIWSEGT